MRTRLLPLSRLFFTIALFAAVPAALGRPAAAALQTATVTPLVRTTAAELPAAPHRIAVSRIIFTPGAAATESIPGPRLVVVESGRLALLANGDLPVTHLEPGLDPAPTVTPLAEPTPERSPTTDLELSPGDAFPVPKQLMSALRNNGSAPSVILDVRVTTDVPSAWPPDSLDVETLGFDDYLTILPTGYVTVSLGRATIPPGGSVTAPTIGDFQFAVAADGRNDLLERGAGGSYRSRGSAALDVFVVTVSQDSSSPLPRPPVQPPTGPGGAEYRYERVVVSHFGTLPDSEYWLFEPADPRGDAGGPLPVVLIVGGCCQDLPDSPTWPPEEIEEWVAHLVKRGTIVVFPLMRAEHAQADIAAAMRAATIELANGTHAAADWSRFAVAGFSFGGTQGPMFAAGAAAAGLPVPSAILSLVPYDPGEAVDLSGIPATTRVLMVIGEDDVDIGDSGARRLWPALAHIPRDQRDLVQLMSDRRGNPPLVADHTITSASPRWGWAPINAHDWYGVWKFADALFSCAWTGEWCAHALGDTPEQRFMGVWSDGSPVIEARVIADPGPPDPLDPATPAS